VNLYIDLPVSAQAAFAGLDVAARDADLRRGVADLPGGFARKKVGAREYWYYQFKTPTGSLQQIYVGPDDAATRHLMAEHSNPDREAARSALTKMTRAAIEYGCTEIPLKHGRIIERLIDYRFFNAGGILVGTHAFLAYQNHLGVRWCSGAQTLDLDFAHAGKNLSIALPSTVRIDATRAIDSLEMGFIPVASKTTFKKPDEPDFDLDFLTTFGRSGDEPVYLPALNLSLQPLKFMELSLEDPMRATLLCRLGPLVVNVPRPHRFALHKLIVYGERVQAQRTKANKDLVQAAALMDYLLKHDSDLVKEGWEDVLGRGPGWSRRLLQGWRALNKAFPEHSYEERLNEVLQSTGRDKPSRPRG